MSEPTPRMFVSRRKAVLLGSGLAALATPAFAQSKPLNPNIPEKDRSHNPSQVSNPGNRTHLPMQKMDTILGAQGQPHKQVVCYSYARTDLHGTLPGGVAVESGALLTGNIYFQSIAGSQAIMNGDICVTGQETNKFIDALIKNGLSVQSFHQHFFDLNPMVWFISFCGQDDPIKLANAAANAIRVTGTPLPQPKPPRRGKSPFDTNRLHQILGGHHNPFANGVLEVAIPRSETFTLNGRAISPDLNIATTVYFQPLDSNAKNALVIPDFGMLAHEIDPVLKKMRSQNWTIGSLSNQETREVPQLFWSQMWKTGPTETLAEEVNNGLYYCNVKGGSR